MAVYRSRGIVLRSIRFKEADRILDLYTVDEGLVSAIAKGVRRTKSKFGGRLEPLSCVEFMAYRGRSLDTLTQAETLESFHEIREDLARFETAARMVGYVRALSAGDEPDRRVFNLLYHAFTALKERDGDYEVLEISFGLKLSTLAGYAIQLDGCAGCGSELDDSGKPLRFAPEIGGLLCSDCSGDVRDSFPVPPETVAAMRSLSSTSLKETPHTHTLTDAMTRILRSHVAANAPAGNQMGSGRLFSGKSRAGTTAT